MTPELIIGIVSAIIGVGFVKVWLYKIIKYKMDEGIVLKHFEDQGKDSAFSTTEIATSAELAEDRVNHICNTSPLFQSDAEQKWRLDKHK